MARKKKRQISKARQAEPSEEVKEELIALEAIFGEHFFADDDGRGFRLVVFPHPGEAQANFVSAELSCRCISISFPSGTCKHCRCNCEIPNQIKPCVSLVHGTQVPAQVP